jgi:hypothetical protein
MSVPVGSVHLSLLIMAGLAGLAGSANAQTAISSADYRTAVAAYRNGDTQLAAELLANRSPESLRHAAHSLVVDDDDWRVIGAAAMLHTGMVIRGRVVSRSDVTLHMRLAVEAIDSERLVLRPLNRELAHELDAFRERETHRRLRVPRVPDPETPTRSSLADWARSEERAARMLAGVVYELRAHLLYGSARPIDHLSDETISGAAGSAGRHKRLSSGARRGSVAG